MPTSPISRALLEDCYNLALGQQHEYITTEHFLFVLLMRPLVTNHLIKNKINFKNMVTELGDYLKSDLHPINIDGAKPKITAMVIEILNRVEGNKVLTSNNDDLNELAVLDQMTSIASSNEDSFAMLLLEKYEIGKIDRKEKEHTMSGGNQESSTQIDTVEQALAFLRLYTINLNERAQEGKIDPMIGRDSELARLILVTSRRNKNNAIIVGESGVGKSVISESLAQAIVDKKVPENLKNAVLFSLDIGAVVAGTKYRGEFEERIKGILKSLSLLTFPILVIDEIHTIMGAGSASGSPMDASNLLKPALAKGELHCIGATTFEEYGKHFEKDRAMVRRFERVDVFAASVSDTKLILRGIVHIYEEFHNVKYTPEALDAMAELTYKYVAKGVLPDKAIDILDITGARAKIGNKKKKKKPIIDVSNVEFEVSKITPIPSSQIKEDEAGYLLRLGGELRLKVFGQDEALQILEDAQIINASGLRDTTKTQGAYLFSGPTGTGKTLVAQTLAKVLGIPLIRFDMSEYMEKHSVARLIGAPPGYIGFDQAGLLTSAIDKQPRVVLLLDEIEKAHPDVFNILLQVLDYGKLTDNNGKTVDFRNVTLIMTTNAGASAMTKPVIGFGNIQRTDEDTIALNEFLTPEFRNRMDAIVKFKALNKENIRLVVDKFLDELTVLIDNRVTIDIDDECKEWLGNKGYDPLNGARAMSRVIDTYIKKPLSRALVFTKGKKLSFKMIGNVPTLVDNTDILEDKFETISI